MPDLHFECSALTDVGRVRTNNEDAVVADAALGLMVLADGMGGYNAGEVASGLAVNMIAEEISRWLARPGAAPTLRDVRRALETAADNACRAIFEASQRNAAYAGMGTTLVMGVMHQGTFVLGHAGDSRAYLFRDGQLTQLTRDHSLLQEQIDSGFITLEEAAASPNRNLVTRALGVEDFVLLDLNESAVQAGDVYLMCSDGLTEMVPDHDIAAMLGNNSLALDAQAARLVAQANANGGRDNVTVALLRACSHGQRKAG